MGSMQITLLKVLGYLRRLMGQKSHWTLDSLSWSQLQSLCLWKLWNETNDRDRRGTASSSSSGKECKLWSQTPFCILLYFTFLPRKSFLHKRTSCKLKTRVLFGKKQKTKKKAFPLWFKHWRAGTILRLKKTQWREPVSLKNMPISKR